jgi:hypothetical protein
MLSNFYKQEEVMKLFEKTVFKFKVFLYNLKKRSLRV